MPVSPPRNRLRSIVGLLGLIATAIFLLPASQAAAEESTVANACKNTAQAETASSIPITISATAEPKPVEPGGTVTLKEIHQKAEVPANVFKTGYELELLTLGENEVPVKVKTQIAATNTVQGTETTNTATTVAKTTITDPTPGNITNGDAVATPGTLEVSYENQTWTAGASGTINFRELTVEPLEATSGGVTIVAELAGGLLKVKFGCDPGEVEEGANVSTIKLIKEATPFASTQIQSQGANEPPTADAGPDQEVASGASVELDGTGSSDPNGESLTYQWTQTEGAAVTLSGAETASPTFTAPTGPETLEFELEVCDEGSPPLCETDSVVITVMAPGENEAPTANAGPDQEVASGASVELDGTGSSDPNGESLTYQWTQTEGAAVTLSGAETASPTFTAPIGPETLEFELEVCDEGSPPLCETDSVVITVMAPGGNEAPTANAGPDQEVESAALVELDGTGSSDPNGESLTYKWTQTEGAVVTLSGAETASPTFTAPIGPEVLEFELEVCDEGSPPLCDTDSVVVIVKAPLVEPFKNAAKECEAEREADPQAFEQHYGTNENLRNAFGMCVSSKVKSSR